MKNDQSNRLSRMGSPEDIPSIGIFAFFALTFIITWGLVGPYIVAPDWAARTFGDISGTHPIYFLATWSPALSAFAVILYFSGIQGLKRFFKRLLLWRLSAGWVLFILLLIPFIFALGSLVKGGPVFAAMPDEGWSAMVAVLFFMLCLGPIEEFGWRGVAQPILQRHMAPIWAGTLIGAMWGFWHLPAFFLANTVYADWNFLPFFIGNVTLAILVTPLFNASRGSILWPLLFHWQLINPFWPDAQPYDTWILAAVAAFIIWWNRVDLFSNDKAVQRVIPAEYAADDNEGRVS